MFYARKNDYNSAITMFVYDLLLCTVNYAMHKIGDTKTKCNTDTGTDTNKYIQTTLRDK